MGTKWMVVVDGADVPLGSHLHTAFSPEVKLVEATLKTPRAGSQHRVARPRQKSRRPTADRGYDNDPLGRQLAARGIKLIAPQRKNRSKPPIQDGRALSRYKRRWVVERAFTWLRNFRRFVVSYDRSLTVYQVFSQIASFRIVLLRVMK